MRVKEAGIPEGRPADTLRAQRHYLGVSPRNATQDFPKRKARKDTTGDRMKQDSAKEFARKHLQVTTWVATMVVAVRVAGQTPKWYIPTTFQDTLTFSLHTHYSNSHEHSRRTALENFRVKLTLPRTHSPSENTPRTTFGSYFGSYYRLSSHVFT